MTFFTIDRYLLFDSQRGLQVATQREAFCMPRRAFTDRLLDLPPRPKVGFDLLFDVKTPGLALRVPAVGQPRFQVIARDGAGKEKRVAFADWAPHCGVDASGARLDLEAIRMRAIQIKANIRAGRPPLWTP